MSGLPWMELYVRARWIRRVEELIADIYPNGDMKCPVHLSIGQELPAAAMALNLGPHDRVFSSHRAHAHYLAMNGSVWSLLKELEGSDEGLTRGFGGSMYLASEDPPLYSYAVVGDCISVAIGDALHRKIRRKPGCAVAVFGDAAVETGQFWEAANFASTKLLPIVFICENNQYATQAHISDRQPSENIVDRVKPFMFSGRVGHGAHTALYNMMGRVMDHSRSGAPSFLQVDTYRLREHVGPHRDDEMGYRSKAEVDAAHKLDPLATLRNKLINKGKGAELVDYEMSQESELSSIGVAP
jgi:TPP-dependent pyruvate/acetoin dehydrogenase alpha subunit